MPVTPNFSLPYPLSSDPADLPADLQALAQAIEVALGSVVTPPALPSGSIVAFGGLVAPTGYLLCDGSTVSRTTYSTLFSAIGVGWNTGGEASTVFRLPDLRGRMPVGIGTHADVNNLGDNEGAVLNSRRPAHKHAVVITDPGHFHTYVVGGQGGTVTQSGYMTQDVVRNTSTKTTGITATAGPQTGAEPLEAPAYVVVSYVIKT